MKSPWNLHEITMKSPWNLHEITMKSPWNHHEISMKSPWNHHEISMKSPWNLHEISMKSPWNLHEITMKGFNSSEKNMSSSLGMMKFPTVSGKSFKIPWFQSPPSSCVLPPQPCHGTTTKPPTISMSQRVEAHDPAGSESWDPNPGTWFFSNWLGYNWGFSSSCYPKQHWTNWDHYERCYYVTVTISVIAGCNCYFWSFFSYCKWYFSWQ